MAQHHPDPRDSDPPLVSQETLQPLTTPVNPNCPSNDLKTLPGFCARIFADNLGHVRHLVVRNDGVIYANTWRGTSYPDTLTAHEGYIVVLQEQHFDQHRMVKAVRFGSTPQSGSAGGTGIALYNGGLYVEVDDKIVRYTLAANEVVPKTPPVTVIAGLPTTGDHPMHPFIIDPRGNLFVNLGSATNACQEDNQGEGVPGERPCAELETRAGLWRYDANKTDQVFSVAERYATGIRDTGGLAVDSAGHLFAMQHGRDQLGANWPELFTPVQNATLPAEELLAVRQGADYGWPFCYFDGNQQKRVLAPEYGGDGGEKVGECQNKEPPLASYPAHWSPVDLIFYNGTQFPVEYQGGAVIAFHGSWDRAPLPQEGYNVVFQRMVDGKPQGPYRVLAEGFTEVNDPNLAEHRPAGLAVGPDGALYVADDQRGRIYRILYTGFGAKRTNSAAPGDKREKPGT